MSQMSGNQGLLQWTASVLLTGMLMPLCPAQDSNRPVAISVGRQAESDILQGASFELEIIADVTDVPDSRGKRWHIYPRKEQHSGVEIPTSIELKSEPPGLEFGEIVWPKTKIIKNAQGGFQPVYEGRTVFTVPVHVTTETATGEYTIQIAFRYQTCASLCLAPTTEQLELTLNIAASPASPVDSPAMVPKSPEPQAPEPREDPAQTLEKSPPAEPRPPGPAAEDFRTNVFGQEFGFSAGSVFAVPLILLFAFVGGFLLNLTPCVLPIIPIKIMGLTQSAAGDLRRTKVLGLAMGAGILVFWLAIGGAISFVSGFDSISSLFQRPVFGIGVGLFIGLMGIGMLVDIVIQLPQSVHRFNPKHDTLPGAFLFGAMTAVLSTPCTAPFMGSSAAWAAKANNPALVLAVFAAIAIGMGWPYVLLSWFPKLVSRVPRTGPASVLVKQVMGLLMLAVAAFFGGTGILGLIKENPHLGPVLHWWVATCLVGLMAFWLSFQTFRITRSASRRAISSLIGLALFGGIVIWSNGETADSWEAMVHDRTQSEAMTAYVKQLENALNSGGPSGLLHLKPPAWRVYEAEAMAKALAKGQVAVVHFTADW